MERRRIVVALGCALGFGCGSGPGREDISVVTFYRGLCDKLQECGCLTPEEAADCQAFEVGLGEEPDPIGPAFDPACLQRMNRLVDGIECGETLDIGFADVCPIYHGSALQGQACADPYGQLDGGFDGGDFEQLPACGPNLMCLAGTCRDPRHVSFGAEGQPCDLLGCDEGLGCVSGVCLRLPGSGQPCLAGECTQGVQCVTDFDPVTGESSDTCVALLDVGAPCTGHAQCASFNCPRGTCEAPAGAGADCGTMLPCGPGYDCVDEVCVAVGPAASGEQCEPLFIWIDTVAG